MADIAQDQEHTDNEDIELDDELENDEDELEDDESEDDESEDDESEDDELENDEDESEDDQSETFISVKESSGGKYDIESNLKQLAAIETKIESSSKKIDTKEFYKNLKEILPKDILELRFEEDDTEYYIEVEKAKEKWLEEQTAPSKELENKLNEAKQDLAVAKAIDSVLKKYPDYNHVKMANFFNEELSKTQQRKLSKGSIEENLDEHLEKVYKLYKKKHPTKVVDVKAPKKPNLSNKPKQTIDAHEDIKAQKEDKEYMESIGFRKL